LATPVDVVVSVLGSAFVVLGAVYRAAAVGCASVLRLTVCLTGCRLVIN
jgi:hypothetical protein